ncbi:hypothetical protein I204_05085 [Kwoniella mangroviensis CBS 8886]|nr:hypothetical protein I204_05085 [Kwoniella mangroviensis CBS 8886]
MSSVPTEPPAKKQRKSKSAATASASGAPTQNPDQTPTQGEASTSAVVQGSASGTNQEVGGDDGAGDDGAAEGTASAEKGKGKAPAKPRASGAARGRARGRGRGKAVRGGAAGGSGGDAEDDPETGGQDTDKEEGEEIQAKDKSKPKLLMNTPSAVELLKKFEQGQGILDGVPPAQVSTFVAIRHVGAMDAQLAHQKERLKVEVLDVKSRVVNSNATILLCRTLIASNTGGDLDKKALTDRLNALESQADNLLEELDAVSAAGPEEPEVRQPEGDAV